MKFHGFAGPGHCSSGTFCTPSPTTLCVLELLGLVQSQETKGKHPPPICVFKAEAEDFLSTLGPVAGHIHPVPRTGSP